MKLNRNKLRKLIQEALKPFFMAVPPKDIIGKLLQDDDVDESLKQLLLNPDPQIKRTGLELAIYDPKLAKKYPELDSDEFYLNTDLVDRSGPAYKEEFESAQQRAEDLELKLQIDKMTSSAEKAAFVEKIAKEIFTNESFNTEIMKDNPPGYITLVLRGDDPEVFDYFPKHLDRDESAAFMQKMRNLGLYSSVYIQTPKMIILTF